MLNFLRITIIAGLCSFLILGFGSVAAYAQDQAAPATSSTPTTPAIPKTPAVNPANEFPSNVQKPLKVEVALVINNISKIIDAAGTFTADIDLRLRWDNPNQSFDPKTVGVSEQSFIGEEATAKLASIWNPKVAIANLAEKPFKQESELYLNANGSAIYLQRLTGTFEAKYKLGNFPFDRQLLPIRLTSKYNSNKVIFWQDQDDIDFSGIPQEIRLAGWNTGSVSFIPSNFKGLDGDSHPQLEAQIGVQRNPASHLPGVFIPLFLVLFVPTIVALWSNTDLDKRISAWAASILTMVALSFTISVRYPALGIENVFFQVIWLGFAFQFLGLAVNSTIMNPSLEKVFGGKYIVAELANFLRWSLPLGLLILVCRVVLLAIV
ncbi:Neurotransmitter-gated ion-channel ligand-binding domain-containing protein [Tumidithrix helvetica PCC 7403]|uniref:hypothetical protein n=1 Tax=Tumidithrix helvetica TaxID=3457545 RepID=UPI003C88E612